MPPFCGAVEQLFDVPIGLTGVEPPLGNVDERLAAAVLRQAQHGPRVTLGEVVVQHELALVPRELQQAQLVGQCGLCHAQPLGGLGLGAVPQHQNVPQALRLLKGVQVGALNIFQQAEGRRLLIGIAAQDGRNGGHLGQLAGAQPPLPCHQLVTFGCFTHRDGLQQTVFTDALGKACQLLFLKGPARLERRRMDLVDGQEINFSGGLLPFKHNTAPPFLRHIRVCFPRFPGKMWKSWFRASVPHKQKPCQKFRSAGFCIFCSLFRYFSGLLAIFPPFLG